MSKKQRIKFISEVKILKHEAISHLKNENIIWKINRIGQKENSFQRVFKRFLRCEWWMREVFSKKEPRKIFTLKAKLTRNDWTSMVCHEVNKSLNFSLYEKKYLFTYTLILSSDMLILMFMISGGNSK